jgi:hypothetical protein
LFAKTVGIAVRLDAVVFVLERAKSAHQALSGIAYLHNHFAGLAGHCNGVVLLAFTNGINIATGAGVVCTLTVGGAALSRRAFATQIAAAVVATDFAKAVW